jgi:hypothetical protein
VPRRNKGPFSIFDDTDISTRNWLIVAGLLACLIWVLVLTFGCAAAPGDRWARAQWLYYRGEKEAIVSYGQATIGQTVHVGTAVEAEVYTGAYYGSLSDERYGLAGIGLTYWPVDLEGNQAPWSASASVDWLVDERDGHSEWVFFGSTEVILP